MNWRIEIKPIAEKQYLKLEKKTRTSVKSALKELVSHENPLFHKDVKPLTGQLKGDFKQNRGTLPEFIDKYAKEVLIRYSR